MATELSEPFGHYTCDVPGFEHVWVRFQPSGYPFGLRRKWKAERDDTATLEMLLPKVKSWNVPDVAGEVVALPDGARPASLVDDIEGALVIWITQTFTMWLLRDSNAPPKAPSPPSTATSST